MNSSHLLDVLLKKYLSIFALHGPVLGDRLQEDGGDVVDVADEDAHNNAASIDR